MSEDLNVYLPGLLAGNPDAVRRFFNAANPTLRSLLRRQYAIVPIEWIDDAIFDTLMAFHSNMALYNSKRGSLLNYLMHMGWNDLRDRIRREKRLDSREKFVGGSVELERVEAHNYQKTFMDCYDGDEPYDTDQLPDDVQALLIEILPEPLDRKILYMCGERQPLDEFARVMQIEHLPEDEQKRLVKKYRDRVLKKVQRRREDFRSLLFYE